MASGSKVMYQHFYQFFALVLRVRQSCDHGALIPEDAFEKAKEAFDLIEEAGDVGDLRLDKDEAKTLLKSLLAVLKPDAEESVSQECGICLEPLVEEHAVAIRACCHVFCQSCLEQTLEKSPQKKCPMCRASFTSRDRISIEDCKKTIKKKNEIDKKKSSSTPSHYGDDQPPKITKLLKYIDNMKADEKGLIFSQWVSYLDLIEAALLANGHTVCFLNK